MKFSTLEECLLFLEKKNELIRIKDEVDPHLEMAAIHLRVHAAGGPAILFEKVKGTRYRAASNIFGTERRSDLLFHGEAKLFRQLVQWRNNPFSAFKQPFAFVTSGLKAIHALPKKSRFPTNHFTEIKITDLPLIHHWPLDGGAFITLPQVYTEDADEPGVGKSNLGMYRIQLTGNNYELNKEAGLHYQLHRGIGIHQTKAKRAGKSLKVSVFVGGPPAHSLAAVMPLPEGLSELGFAGLMSARRFRYAYEDGFLISLDADFIITGEVLPDAENKPEGPFGDHLGYYSLQHPFPVMKVHKVYAKKNAIWPFTVVGRPPQEDTMFGNLIHHITGNVLPKEIPGLKDLNAVDEAGVHPLLLAVGSERYTPYIHDKKPAEILTIAHRILGTGQLSIAKFLFITADDDNVLKAHNKEAFFHFFLQRFQPERDIHFITKTTIDTLDYSGTALNEGSKVIFCAYGEVVRELCTEVPASIAEHYISKLVVPGIVAIQINEFSDYNIAQAELKEITGKLSIQSARLNSCPFILITDDAAFTAASFANFLWVCFTKANPASDIYGVNSFTSFKHWGCSSSVIIDARTKPHHAPPLMPDKTADEKAKKILEKVL